MRVLVHYFQYDENFLLLYAVMYDMVTIHLPTISFDCLRVFMFFWFLAKLNNVKRKECECFPHVCQAVKFPYREAECLYASVVTRDVEVKGVP
jgi:hypothetical protein